MRDFYYCHENIKKTINHAVNLKIRDTPVLLAGGRVAYHSGWAGQGREPEPETPRPALFRKMNTVQSRTQISSLNYLSRLFFPLYYFQLFTCFFGPFSGNVSLLPSKNKWYASSEFIIQKFVLKFRFQAFVPLLREDRTVKRARHQEWEQGITWVERGHRLKFNKGQPVDGDGFYAWNTQLEFQQTQEICYNL